MIKYVVLALTLIISTLVESVFASYFFSLALMFWFFMFGEEKLSVTVVIAGGLAHGFFGTLPIGSPGLALAITLLILSILKRLLPKSYIFAVVSFLVSVISYDLMLGILTLDLNFPSFLLILKNMAAFALMYPVSKFSYELIKTNSV